MFVILALQKFDKIGVEYYLFPKLKKVLKEIILNKLNVGVLYGRPETYQYVFVENEGGRNDINKELNNFAVLNVPYIEYFMEQPNLEAISVETKSTKLFP